MENDSKEKKEEIIGEAVETPERKDTGENKVEPKEEPKKEKDVKPEEKKDE